jgi:hypothetical protein
VLPSDGEPSSSALKARVASHHYLVASIAIGSYGEDSYMGISYLVQAQCYIHLRTYIKESLIVYIYLKRRLHPFFIYIGCRYIKSEEKYKIAQEKYIIVQEKYKVIQEKYKIKEFGLDLPHYYPIALSRLLVYKPS